MMIPLLLLAASLSGAQPLDLTAQSGSSAATPIGAASVSILKARFIEALDDATKGRMLQQISVTRPVSARDVSALFDLFSRNSDPVVRRKVMDSLALIDPSSPQLEPMFLTYLRQPEPETSCSASTAPSTSARARPCR